MDAKTFERLDLKYKKKNEEYMKAHANDMMRRGPGGGRGPAGKVGKPKNTKESIGRLFSYIRHDTWKIAIVLVLVVISSLTNLAGTYVLRPVMNSLTDGTGTVAILAKGIGVMAILYATGILAQYAISLRHDG